MTACRHKTLILLPHEKNRLRCRHCHLTIKTEDLTQNFCPECYELEGKKKNDFEEIASPDADETRYRCDACGMIIKGD